MQFFNLSEVEFYPKGNLFKPSAIKNLLMSVLCTAMFSGIPAVIYFNEEMSLLAFIIFMLVGLLVFVFTFKTFLKSLKPDSWLLNIQPSGMLIKYRSYHNRKLPAEDKQIVYLDFNEIESVNKTTITRYTARIKKGKYRSQISVLHYLDIVLRSEQNKRLAQALFDELGKRIQSKNGSSISHHRPVSLVGDRILRINFRGYTPSVAKVLEIISANVTINDTKKIAEDFSKSIDDDQKLRDVVLLLTAYGERFAAKALVRKSRKLRNSEAKDYIDEIINRQPRKNDDDIDELEVAG